MQGFKSHKEATEQEIKAVEMLEDVETEADIIERTRIRPLQGVSAMLKVPQLPSNTPDMLRPSLLLPDLKDSLDVRKGITEVRGPFKFGIFEHNERCSAVPQLISSSLGAAVFAYWRLCMGRSAL